MDALRIVKLGIVGAIGYGVYLALTGEDFSPVEFDAVNADGTAAPSANAVSANGVALIQSQEGFEASAYVDGSGYSIGYGHHITGGDGLTSSSTISPAQAQQLFTQDIATVQNAINSLVKVPLTQNQYDALADFVYNEGAGAFASSTLLEDINAGDFEYAAMQFALWTLANGAHNAGLAARRQLEANLFTTPQVSA